MIIKWKNYWHKIDSGIDKHPTNFAFRQGQWSCKTCEHEIPYNNHLYVVTVTWLNAKVWLRANKLN